MAWLCTLQDALATHACADASNQVDDGNLFLLTRKYMIRVTNGRRKIPTYQPGLLHQTYGANQAGQLPSKSDQRDDTE